MAASFRQLRLRAAVSAPVGGRAVGAALALAAVGTALARGPQWLTLLLALLALTAVCLSGRQRRRSATGDRDLGLVGSSLLSRVLIVLAGAVAAITWPEMSEQGPLAAATVLLVAALFAESAVSTVARAAGPYAANLASIRVRNYPMLRPAWVFRANSASVALFLLWAAGVRWLPGWVAIVTAVLAVLVEVVVIGDGLLRLRGRRSAERMLPKVLAELAPTFLLYWEAPPGSAHQIAMWLPYLSRLNRPYMIVLRTPGTFAETVALTTAPVLLRRYVRELDVLITPGLKSVFFVNTAPKNVHMLQYLGIHQIQLNHGDSDKAPSYRRIFRMYDKNFVAGQAAIDRFAKNGVVVPRDAFEIVGRPQVETVQIEKAPIATLELKRVLYAPTWYGYLEDSRYSSLPIGERLVQALVNRGCVIVFRPHPWIRRTPALLEAARRIDRLLSADAVANGRQHVTGSSASAGSILDTFNQVDALISDVSSVIPDFLYSEKPFAITSMVPGVGREEFLADFPIARAGYVLTSDLANLDVVLDDLLVNDPAAELRRNLKTYYLGDFPVDNYAEGFLAAARRYV
jgi:CDP-Glycerol:Poly(glycerophosphate) glycerophosphotransferase